MEWETTGVLQCCCSVVAVWLQCGCSVVAVWLQCVAVCCSVVAVLLQCVAVLLQCESQPLMPVLDGRPKVCCSVVAVLLHCVAACCTMLQCRS